MNENPTQGVEQLHALTCALRCLCGPGVSRVCCLNVTLVCLCCALLLLYLRYGYAMFASHLCYFCDASGLRVCYLHVASLPPRCRIYVPSVLHLCYLCVTNWDNYLRYGWLRCSQCKCPPRCCFRCGQPYVLRGVAEVEVQQQPSDDDEPKEEPVDPLGRTLAEAFAHDICIDEKRQKEKAICLASSIA